MTDGRNNTVRSCYGDHIINRLGENADDLIIHLNAKSLCRLEEIIEHLKTAVVIMWAALDLSAILGKLRLCASYEFLERKFAPSVRLVKVREKTSYLKQAEHFMNVMIMICIRPINR